MQPLRGGRVGGYHASARTGQRRAVPLAYLPDGDRAVAVVADEAEGATLYERFTAAYPQLADYQDRTIRRIPVVVLTRG